MDSHATTDIKPLIPESSTSESTNLQTILQDLEENTLTIPDYQRDSDQWGKETKSLLIESVINNLTIPAFFFEVRIDEQGLENNEVVDGQQRLSTLHEFYKNKFRLVSSDDATYLSPHSVHYAGKTFDELPKPYQQAFKKFRLAIIKLRDLDQMRLEVFRRINQGGTPLSGQDIRLAYYGNNSKSVTLIRLAGIFDSERPAAKRFLESAALSGLANPWSDADAKKSWCDWWNGKTLSSGQKPSEMFLWALVASDHENLSQLVANKEALARLQCRFNRTIDEALDAYCAQLAYQEKNNDAPPLLKTFSEAQKQFFPYFQSFIGQLLGIQMTNAPLQKYRIIAGVIGASYAEKLDLERLSRDQWTSIVEFIRRPAEICKQNVLQWPASKGKWDGNKGYHAQFTILRKAIRKVCFEATDA